MIATNLPEYLASLPPGEALELDECGCCGSWHLPVFCGDCRDDLERFPVPRLPDSDFNLDGHLAHYAERIIPFNDPRNFRH